MIYLHVMCSLESLIGADVHYCFNSAFWHDAMFFIVLNIRVFTIVAVIFTMEMNEIKAWLNFLFLEWI